VGVPALFFAGAKDRIAPPSAVRAAFDAWGAERSEVDKEWRLLGRAVYLELHLLRGVVMGDDDLAARVRHLFAEAQAPRSELDAQLPPRDHLLNWAGEVFDQDLSNLNSQTIPEFYRELVTDVGGLISTKKMREDNIETIILDLTNQQSQVSGVNINDEAARMLIFEQMFGAMAKYMSTVHASISTIMEII